MSFDSTNRNSWPAGATPSRPSSARLSATSAHAEPPLSAHAGNNAITVRASSSSSTPAATAPARSVTPSRRRLGSNLQHVLPAGFHKVRYYGLWHASRQLLRNLRNVLLLAQPARPPAEPAPEPDADPQAPPSPRRCPHCQTGHLTLLRRLSPARPQGPLSSPCCQRPHPRSDSAPPPFCHGILGARPAPPQNHRKSTHTSDRSSQSARISEPSSSPRYPSTYPPALPTAPPTTRPGRNPHRPALLPRRVHPVRRVRSTEPARPLWARKL